MLRMNELSGARKILYLNGAAGISGDMFLGALTDAAVSLDRNFSLAERFAKIKLFEPGEVELSVSKETRGGITGVKVGVITPDEREHDSHGHHGHHDHHENSARNLSGILETLAHSDLPSAVRDMSSLAFTLLAEAEAEVHGVTPEEIHFHEAGAADSIADIVGAMLLMDHFGWPEVISSPINVGSGTVKCAHGVLPVPAPATSLLLKDMKIFSSGIPIERTTPTGALLLRALSGPDGFRDLPAGRVLCVGTGLGSKDTPDIPNALRVMLIEPEDAQTGRFLRDEPSLVEANIDDMNPQDFARAADLMLEQGALDVWRESILM
ncbi:MAG: LarC family nickel insertion protein, partial [Synergistaceae bacterium]|nr:LarC family nickel insertion protein [Synergistaceae bacterium]